MATSYRISTITVTGSVNSEINLDLMFDSLNSMILERGVGKDETCLMGLVYAEYGKKRSSTYYTGFSKKFVSQRKKENVSKRFDNQLTVIYKFNEESLMNIKVFKNGNVQITGVKQISQGKEMIDILITLIKEAVDNCTEGSVALSKNELANSKYKVALINSDFKIGFEIKRDKLYSVLINEYENKCSFEPCIYPGVKIQYFWNSYNALNDGVCCCKENCFSGKGNGGGDGDCKKITIAVFQSGCIIITGAQTTGQIDAAYKFICDILFSHKEFVRKINITSILPQTPIEEKKVKVILKKSSIIYPNLPTVSSNTHFNV